MVVNSTNVNKDFINAVFNWLCQFPEQIISRSNTFVEVIQPNIINRLLMNILDDTIEDYSEEFYIDDDENGIAGMEMKIKYFEKLMNMVSHCYIKYNTHLINPNANACFYSMDENGRVKSSDETKTPGSHITMFAPATRLSVSESYRNNTLNYYLKSIIPQKLFSIKGGNNDLSYGDYVQIQALFSLFIEVGLHCKKAPLCITLISFLEAEDKQQFESFLLRNTQVPPSSSSSSSLTYGSYSKKKNSRMRLTIYDNEINIIRNNNEDMNMKNELKTRIAKLEKNNNSLKYELEMARNQAETYKQQTLFLHDAFENTQDNEACIKEITEKYLDKKKQVDDITQKYELSTQKLRQETQSLKEKLGELKTEMEILKEQNQKYSEMQKTILEKTQNIPGSAKFGEFEKDNADTNNVSTTTEKLRENDYTKSLKWDLELMNQFYFTKQLESLNMSKEPKLSASKLFKVKKSGREIHHLFVK